MGKGSIMGRVWLQEGTLRGHTSEDEAWATAALEIGMGQKGHI